MCLVAITDIVEFRVTCDLDEDKMKKKTQTPNFDVGEW